MAAHPDNPDWPPPTEPDDPRLQIPAELRESPSHIKVRATTSPPESAVAGMAKAWAVALDFMFTILGMGFLGWLFDRWQGTGSTGSLIGLGVGFVGAFYRIVRHTQKQERLEAEAKRKR